MIISIAFQSKGIWFVAVELITVEVTGIALVSTKTVLFISTSGRIKVVTVPIQNKSVFLEKMSLLPKR